MLKGSVFKGSLENIPGPYLSCRKNEGGKKVLPQSQKRGPFMKPLQREVGVLLFDLWNGKMKRCCSSSRLHSEAWII